MKVLGLGHTAVPFVSCFTCSLSSSSRDIILPLALVEEDHRSQRRWEKKEAGLSVQTLGWDARAPCLSARPGLETPAAL